MATAEVEWSGAADQRSAPWRLLWRVLLERRWLAAAIALTGCLELAPTAALPLVLGAAIDGGVAAGDRAALWGAVGLLLLLGAAMLLGAGLGNYLSALLWLHGAVRTEQLVHDHAARAGGAVTARVRGGEVAAVGSADVYHVGALLESCGRVFGSVAAFVVVAVLLFGRSSLLAAVVLVGVPLAVVGIGPLVRPLQRRQARQREHFGEAATMAADIVAGLRILRGVGGEDAFGRRFARTSQQVRAAGVAVGRVDSWLAAAEVFLPGLVTVAITWLGARLVLAGTISLGELFAFYLSAAYLVVPVSVATEAIDSLSSALVAARRARRILDVRPEPPDPEHPVPLPAGPLELVDETSGLVCAAGLLTVVDAGNAAGELGARLVRLAEPAPRARVLAGGVDIATVAVDELRARILLAAAEDGLFSGPVLAEVAGCPGTGPGTGADTGVDPAAALRAASADEVLEHIPDGLLDERGRALSGGQRQRLLLARALCAGTDVLVLEEPTSAVDAHTEARIAAAVAALRAGRTTVVLTQSALWAPVADAVVRARQPEPAR